MENKYWNKFLTIPNMISLARIASSIGIVAALVLFGINPSNALGLTIWTGITAATDFVDGGVARKFNQQSKWGMLLDPVADKVLNWGIGIYLIAAGYVPAAILAIGARDLVVAGVTAIDKYKDGLVKTNMNNTINNTSFKEKLKAFKAGDGMAPTIWAKSKMWAQSLGIISALAFGYGTTSFLNMISPICMMGAIGLCAADLVVVYKNIKQKEYKNKQKNENNDIEGLPLQSNIVDNDQKKKTLVKEKTNIPLKVTSKSYYVKAVDEIIEDMAKPQEIKNNINKVYVKNR